MYLQTIELASASLESLAAFYGGVLGLAIDLAIGERRLTIAAGTTELVVRADVAPTGPYHFAFNVPENRLGAAIEFLRARSIPLVADESGENVFTFDEWNAHAVYFTDPAGNIVECIARHDLANSAHSLDEAFSPSEILCVSEIGIPTGDVPQLVAAYCEQLGIGIYRSSGPAFAALGDENGLLIVVQRHRVWFPTRDIRAEAVPLSVVLRGDQGRFVIRDSSEPLRCDP